MNQYSRPIQTKAAPIQLKNLHGDVFISITRHDEYIESKWRGHITADDVITAATAYLAHIQQYPCPKLLNDKSEVTGDWEEALSWLEFEWLPQVKDAGLRCITHIYSQDMFSQLSARDLHLRALPFLQMENFSDREQAINWLLTCDTNLLSTAR